MNFDDYQIDFFDDYYPLFSQSIFTMSYADFDDDFQQADVPEGSDAEEAPCGKYQCEITRFFDNETQDGTQRLNGVLKVISGEHAGKVIYKSWLLSPSAMPYIKADFKRFGLPVETTRFSELRRMLDTDVIGKRCEAVKKENEKNTKYANVYINSMLSSLEKPSPKQSEQAPSIYEEAKTTPPETKDDLPF